MSTASPLARAAAAALLALSAAPSSAQDRSAPMAAQPLRSAQSFDAIADPQERSRALFSEAGRVIQSPRCVNCHPAGDRPLQGQGLQTRLHIPNVTRGVDGKGATALRCASCHQAKNNVASGVPGHAMWHIAPREMAWQHMTLPEICEQIKDPKRNGGRTLAQIHEHMAHDTLVGWAWMPGAQREPAPGTQAQFGELVDAWIKTGAFCPK
ncbi:Isoquinoline 1-oxidoreductase subunit [Mitsuaria sp. GD03876]|uniref:Isoquinoline 1-oxidoreductase subunit n=1 Tax=Mitsuaria sp. GD03876 TaxID=2975399 RepID=UPI00244B90F8|nr:Isoquinoline 1-oxidoreductase subunit [Mitsuaria sp. GD03876]MDH0867525.1 Isoquinoline 1-oxidoreductase subunit [Mitsuaria sp. GD03876]